MIRVLHIQKLKGIAGSERHLLTLLPRLDRARFAPSMLMLEEPARPVDQFARELEAAGVHTRRVTIRRDVDPVCWYRVRAAVARGRYDIVHTHLIHGDLYGVTAAAFVRPRPRVIASKHGYENYAHTTPLYKIGYVLNPVLSRVVTISDALQPKVADAEGLPRAKMVTIHYGLDLPAKAEPPVIAEPLKLVSVGRLVNVKGYPYLLQALAALGPEASRVHLTIVGDGPERERLTALAAALRIASHVTFAGWQQDVRAYLRDAHVFVLPTLGEGFGLAVLEAMGEALPVIASNTMSLPEIVADGVTGWLVPPADANALAAAIRRCLEHPGLLPSMGAAGRVRGLDLFSVSRMVQQTEALYEDVMKDAR